MDSLPHRRFGCKQLQGASVSTSPDHNAMAAGQGTVPDPSAIQQFEGVRQIFRQPEYTSVAQVFWNKASNKRGPPTPVASTPATTPAEAQSSEQHMEVDTAGERTAGQPELLQPFSYQTEAALSVTAGALGVDINDHNAIEAWKRQPVANNAEVFNMVRAYHEKVIRPEYFSLVCQLESSLKQVHDKIFYVKKSLAWMQADNRLSQKYACGTQLLTVGWPQGMPPSDRNYMISWLLAQTPTVVEFLKARGMVTDHNAHELSRFLNALSQEPTTVPQGGDFFSSMTLLTFKSFDLRKAVLDKYGGGNGVPLYKDEATPVANRHLRVAPCSPQWQRKLEAPLRVVLSCVNASPDHNATSRLVILWKTLTIMAPVQGQEFQEDITAWARVHYFEENGEFVGRLEIVEELKNILMSPAQERAPETTTLWQEHWNKVMWGNQMELDLADAQAVQIAKAQAGTTGAGWNIGRGRRHWSNTAIHTSEYEPYPFELQFVVVDHIFFSWDEMCDKFGAASHKVGDYSIATRQGKPPPSVAADLSGSAQTTTPTGAAAASTDSMPPPSNPPKSAGRGRGYPKGKGF